MLHVFMQKRGVSPLIATVLLIAFAVALGSVVMNWGLNLNSKEQVSGCSNIKFQTREISSSEVCYAGSGQNGSINFIVDNTGSSEINGIAIAIIGSRGTKLQDIDNALIKKGSLFTKTDNSVAYDFVTYGDINQVQFIPKIISSSGTELCPESAIKAQKIGQCS